MVKCIEGLYDLWRVRDVHTLTQVVCHRALITKSSKAREPQGGPPPCGFLGAWQFSLFFCVDVETRFSIFVHCHRIQACTIQEKRKKLPEGSVLGETKFVVRHMHHGMNMTALDQRVLGLELDKASYMDDLV